MKKKKTIVLISMLLVLVLCITGILVYRNQRFALSIDGEPVTREEFLYTMKEQIYDVNQYFFETYNVTLKNSSWDEEFGGEYPYQVLADGVIEQLKYDKAVYGLSKEKGYIEESSYQGLLDRLEQENTTRAQKIKAGEPVYGLSSFDFKLFKEYELDNLQKQYCAGLENEGMSITEEERRDYYESNKDAKYQKNDSITLDYIKISYQGEGMTEQDVAGWKEKLSDMYKKIDEDHSLSELASEESGLSAYLSHEELASEEVASYTRMMGDVLDYAYSLKKGEATQVIDENGCLYLIQCTDRTAYDYVPLDEVKDHINKELREKHYELIIEKRAETSMVDGNMKQIYDFTKKQIKE